MEEAYLPPSFVVNAIIIVTLLMLFYIISKLGPPTNNSWIKVLVFLFVHHLVLGHLLILHKKKYKLLLFVLKTILSQFTVDKLVNL